MSPQLVPSSPDSDGLLSTYSGLPPSSTPPPTCPLPLLRAVDERPMAYLLVIPLRQFFARFLTLPSSRDLAFSNSLRLGICFTPLKEKFVRNGDLSGRVVHPWFVYYMNVMGVHLHQETRHQWLELKTQGMLTQILLRIVLEMQETQPPTTMLHAFYFMAMACTYTHTVVPGQRYLGRCQDMIEKEGFRLVDPTWIDASLQGSSSAVDRPSPYTEEKHELVSILLNLMYLQCIHRMIYSECDGMFAELEAQLPEFEVRRLLRDHVPWDALLNYHFTAGLSGGFRTLFDYAQNSHRSFGPGRVPAYQSAHETRFVHLPRKYRCYRC